MSHLEICDALFADRTKLQIKANSLIPKMAKQFKKERKFPAWKWVEYTHQQSHNRYLISFYAPNPAFADKPDVNFLAFMEEDRQKIVIQWGCWMYRKNGSLDAIATRYIGYFSGHFFSRYREKVWKDVEMSYNELLSRYFSRNIATIPLELNEDIQSNYKEYGELAQYAFKVPEGTCFIRQWNEGDEGSLCTPPQYSKSKTPEIMQDKTPILDYETCEYIGYEVENAVFFNLKNKLNSRHSADNGIPYFDSLALEIHETEGLLSDGDTPVKVEIMDLLKEEYHNLDEFNRHCLYIYLGSNEEENEMVQELAWHFEEWLEDRYNVFISAAKNNNILPD